MRTLLIALLIILIFSRIAVAYDESYNDRYFEGLQMQQQLNRIEAQQILNNAELQRQQNAIRQLPQLPTQHLLYPNYPPTIQYRYGREYELLPGQTPGQPSYQYQLRE